MIAFSLTRAASGQTPTATESVLYSLNGTTDSTSPAAALIQGSDGNLYGTTLGNFFTDYGSVFKVGLDGTFTPVYHFSGGTDSATLLAPVVEGGDGNLYGTTVGNLLTGTDGTVFQLAPDSATLTNLYQFTGGANGASPYSGLVEGSDGNFYGGTSSGGSPSYGTLFQITPAGALTTIVSFNNFNGGSMYYPPVEGTDGNFYGVTNGGGSGGSSFGTVYQLTPTGTLTTLYSFRGAGDGASPEGPLVEGPDGNFYGATGGNGIVSAANGGNGTIFVVTPAGALTTLYVLNGTTDGASPYGLFLASDGNLYGLTASGGTNGKGTIFEVTRSGTFTTLYSFAASGDGSTPQAGLMQASDGNFYGTTADGGSSGTGAIIKLAFSPALAAPVQVTSSAASVPLGSSITLNWQVLNAFSKTFQNCYASVSPSTASTGGWSGLQPGTYNATTQIYSGTATFTPSLPGSYVYGLTCGGVESGSAEVTVGDASSLLITTASLPVAKVGVAYSATVQASGGVKPYTFSVPPSALPAGLSLNPATGVISGTPTAYGLSDFTVTVTDSDPVSAATVSANLEINVVVPLAITNTGFPDGRAGAPYSAALTASGGTPPYTWSLSNASSLPAGLSLTPDGTISGTPTAAGTTNFTVSVADSAAQQVNGAFSITIDPPITSAGTVTVNPTSIDIGQTIVASVSISAPAGSPVPTGTVQFQSNGVNIGSPVAVTNGAATLTTSPFTATGSFAITAVYSGDINYRTESYPPAMLAVGVAPVPAIAVTPSAVAIAQGAAATLTATVLNFGSGSVTLSCGTLPANVSCSFSPLSASGTATLTIEAQSTASALPAPAHSGNWPRGLVLALVFPGLLALRRSRRAKHIWAKRILPVLLLLAAALSMMTACADGGKSVKLANVGSSVIVVTATAGNQTASTAITLSVE